MDNAGGVPATVGVSVVICCYNSAARLPETLAHLAAQTGADGIPWEVLVIDNASTDDTADVARRLWPADSAVPLRVLKEPRPGKTYALHTGLYASRYEFFSTVDDDNWVAPDWIARVFHLMMEHPEIGACGGIGKAVCEQPPPPWFEEYGSNYAVGPQAPAAGYIPIQRGYLYGAGLTIRRSAWIGTIQNGYKSLLTCRKGDALTSGGDVELSLALLIGGWKLWYDPALTFEHYMPAGRLSWNYLRALKRGCGLSEVWLELYRQKLSPPPVVAFRTLPLPASVSAAIRETWLFRMYFMLRILLSADRKLWKRRDDPELEGSAELLEWEWQLGRISGLLRAAFVYHWKARSIRSAGWADSLEQRAFERVMMPLRSENGNE